MRQPNRDNQRISRVKAIGTIIAAYLLGTSGGLFLYPYIFTQALVGFVLLGIGIIVLIFFALRPERS